MCTYMYSFMYTRFKGILLWNSALTFMILIGYSNDFMLILLQKINRKATVSRNPSIPRNRIGCNLQLLQHRISKRTPSTNTVFTCFRISVTFVSTYRIQNWQEENLQPFKYNWIRIIDTWIRWTEGEIWLEPVKDKLAYCNTHRESVITSQFKGDLHGDRFLDNVASVWT